MKPTSTKPQPDLFDNQVDGTQQQQRYRVIHNRTGRVHVEAASLTEIADLLYADTADRFTIHDRNSGEFCNATIINKIKPAKK